MELELPDRLPSLAHLSWTGFPGSERRRIILCLGKPLDRINRIVAQASVPTSGPGHWAILSSSVDDGQSHSDMAPIMEMSWPPYTYSIRDSHIHHWAKQTYHANHPGRYFSQPRARDRAGKRCKLESKGCEHAGKTTRSFRVTGD